MMIKKLKDNKGFAESLFDRLETGKSVKPTWFLDGLVAYQNSIWIYRGDWYWSFDGPADEVVLEGKSEDSANFLDNKDQLMLPEAPRPDQAARLELLRKTQEKFLEVLENPKATVAAQFFCPVALLVETLPSEGDLGERIPSMEKWIQRKSTRGRIMQAVRQQLKTDPEVYLDGRVAVYPGFGMPGIANTQHSRWRLYEGRWRMVIY